MNENPMLTPDPALGLAAEVFAEAPPEPLRARVLGSITERPRPRTARLGPVETLACVVADLDDLLGSLNPSEWRSPNALAELDVKRVVAHLEGADRYLGVNVGLWEGSPPDDQNDHRAASQDLIDAAADKSSGEVLRSWRDRSSALIAGLRALPDAALGAPGKYHIFEAPLGSVLLARSFEVWTHTEDICRATGRALRPPQPAALAAMTEAGTGLAPLSYVLNHGPAAATVRVVLTGPGAGTWTFPLGPDAPTQPTATIVTDAVGFCRLVADRVTPAELDVQVEGDTDLAELVLAGVSMLALD